MLTALGLSAEFVQQQLNPQIFLERENNKSCPLSWMHHGPPTHTSASTKWNIIRCLTNKTKNGQAKRRRNLKVTFIPSDLNAAPKVVNTSYNSPCSGSQKTQQEIAARGSSCM